MSNVDNTLYSFLIDTLNQTFLSWGFDTSIIPVISIKLIYWLGIIWYLCLFLTVVFFIGIIYITIKIDKIRQFESNQVYGKQSLIEGIKTDFEINPPKRNQDWEKIIKLIGSDSPNDWKLAIIEADKVLEIVVNTFVVPGDNLGEKLRNIEKSDFTNLNEAWQAHKVRNKIAHEHNFHLGQREARLAIDNYEKVFKEFDFI